MKNCCCRLLEFFIINFVSSHLFHRYALGGKKKQVDYSASTYGKCSFLLSSSPESVIDAKLIAF
jgi:hypothetical protein